MSAHKYDKATATAIFQMPVWADSCTIREDGVFLNDKFRVNSQIDSVFDWTPAYDMDWPESPNPLTAPVLPIPFTAKELAACLLDGPGAGIQEKLGRRIGYALEEHDAALARFRLSERHVRDALRDAYALAAQAQLHVGEFDYEAEQQVQALNQQLDDANNAANAREGVFEVGISRDEANRRRALATESVADLKVRADHAEASVKAKWFGWRKAMVRQLLGTATSKSIESSESDSANPKEKSEQLAHRAAWLTHTLDADMWWRTEAVSPVHAAMLLSRWNPNEMSVEEAETHSSDEMGPQDFLRLKNAFEGAGKSANRTLQNWVDYARQRNLRIHSWIGEWEECMQALYADAISQADPHRAVGAPSAPVQRSAAQEAAIIAAIRSAGHDPLTLPANEPGKPGMKSVIRQALNSNSLFVGANVFDKAWERLRQQGDVANRVEKT